MDGSRVGNVEGKLHSGSRVTVQAGNVRIEETALAGCTKGEEMVVARRGRQAKDLF